MEITTQVFVLLFVLLSPNGDIETRVAFTKSMEECNEVASWMIKDSTILNLHSIRCTSGDAPLSGMKTRHLDTMIY